MGAIGRFCLAGGYVARHNSRMKLSLAFLLYLMVASSVIAASLRAQWDVVHVLVAFVLVALGVAVANMVNISKPPAELIAAAEILTVVVIGLLAVVFGAWLLV